MWTAQHSETYKYKALRTANVECGWHVLLERQLVINSGAAVRARVSTSIHKGAGGVKRCQISYCASRVVLSSSRKEIELIEFAAQVV